MIGKNKVILALGSNCEPKANIQKAQTMLELLFPGITFTRVVVTDPVGDIPRDEKFHNCLGTFWTAHGLSQVKRAVKQLEHRLGKGKGMLKKGIVKIDLDILSYNDTKCHGDDWGRSYIQELMKEI